MINLSIVNIVKLPPLFKTSRIHGSRSSNTHGFQLNSVILFSTENWVLGLSGWTNFYNKQPQGISGIMQQKFICPSQFSVDWHGGGEEGL